MKREGEGRNGEKWDGEKDKGREFKRVKGEGERRSLLCPPTPPKNCGHSNICCSTKRCLGASV